MYQQQLKAPGNVNAAHVAYIKDATGKIIGTCMDTPNNAAYAFSLNKNAVTIDTPFNGTWTREELAGRERGLDLKYHAQYINYYK